MTVTELKNFREILNRKQDELERFMRNRDGIAIEQSADALDEVQHATERELAIRNLDRDAKLLRNVRAALRRIQDGSFGHCLHCEDEINLKRLGAIPWALFCVRGQEEEDRRQKEGEALLEEVLISRVTV